MSNSKFRIALSIGGLILVLISFVLMFQGFWLWGWLTIAVAFGISWLARRV